MKAANKTPFITQGAQAYSYLEQKHWNLLLDENYLANTSIMSYLGQKVRHPAVGSLVNKWHGEFGITLASYKDLSCLNLSSPSIPHTHMLMD